MRFYGILIAILIELVPTDSTATMNVPTATSCDEAWAGLCMQEYGWLRALGRSG